MEAGSEPMAEHRGRRATDRFAAWFLLALLAGGTLVLWIGVPIGSLKLAAELTQSSADHFLLALFLTVAGMVAFGALLFWVNGLYLRVTGALRPRSGQEHDEDEPARVRGPLELFLVVSLVIAIAALFVWFFAFAENPSPQVI